MKDNVPLRFIGGPKDGATVGYPEPLPRVLIFQGRFPDGVFRIANYTRTGTRQYTYVP